jgi:hypothetical protein
MTWLPWLICGVLLGLLLGAVRVNRRLKADVLALQRRLTDERSAHYLTECRLGRRDRAIGAMRLRLAGLAEIAQGSAQLSQVYTDLVQAAQWRESEPAPLD